MLLAVISQTPLRAISLHIWYCILQGFLQAIPQANEITLPVIIRLGASSGVLEYLIRQGPL